MSLNAEVGSKTMADPAEVNLDGAFQPKALIAFGSYSGGNPQAHAILSAGFADGTSQACVSIRSQDGSADSDAGRKYSVDRFSEMLGGDLATPYYSAALSSFDNDGFTITKAGAADANGRYSYLALGGSDLTNARIIEWTQRTSNGTDSVTGFGFKPDAIIELTGLLASAGASANAHLQAGWATADAQYSVAIRAADALATTDTYRVASNTRISQWIDSGGFINDIVTVSGFTADGFDYTMSSTSGSGFVHRTLGLKFTSPGYVKAGHITTGTANGVIVTASGLGHTPKAVLLLGPHATAFNLVGGDINNSFGAFDGSRRAMAAIFDQDNQATSAAKSWFDTTNVAAIQQGTATLYERLHSPSLGSGTFSLVPAKTDTTARMIPFLSFGEPDAGKALSGLSGKSGLAI